MRALLQYPYGTALTKTSLLAIQPLKTNSPSSCAIRRGALQSAGNNGHSLLLRGVEQIEKFKTGGNDCPHKLKNPLSDGHDDNGAAYTKENPERCGRRFLTYFPVVNLRRFVLSRRPCIVSPYDEPQRALRAIPANAALKRVEMGGWMGEYG